MDLEVYEANLWAGLVAAHNRRKRAEEQLPTVARVVINTEGGRPWVVEFKSAADFGSLLRVLLRQIESLEYVTGVINAAAVNDKKRSPAKRNRAMRGRK